MRGRRQLTWETDQLQKRVESSGEASVPGDTAPTARDSANEDLLRVLRLELSEARSRLAVRFVHPALFKVLALINWQAANNGLFRHKLRKR